MKNVPFRHSNIIKKGFIILQALQINWNDHFMVTNFLELDETLGRIFVHRKLAEAEKERRINKSIENADRLIYFQSETVRGRKKFFFHK